MAEQRSKMSQWYSILENKLSGITCTIWFAVFENRVTNNKAIKNVFGVMFNVVVITFIISLTVSITCSKSTKAWPSANGKILESEVIERSEESAVAEILYEYAVDGKKYTSDRVRDFGMGVFNFPEYASLAEEFPSGKEVLVFYDPNDPSSAVLLHGPAGGVYISLLIFVGMFLGRMFLARRKHVKRDDTEGEGGDS